jgi:hypothetical protein
MKVPSIAEPKILVATFLTRDKLIENVENEDPFSVKTGGGLERQGTVKLP